MNDLEYFVKFEVITNEIPIGANLTSGKDIVVDWGLMDHFDTDGRIFLDTNGLQMNTKELFKRKEYTYDTNNTISANYYPITSAVMVRDYNQSSKYDNFQRQVTVMVDQPHGASAGLRSHRNIEIMHHRRH